MNIWQDFKVNDGKIVYKWSNYFPVYERHLSSWRNKTITFWEIGVYKGGSLPLWSRFFGPMATIVGIDIDPNCKSHETDEVHVRIGDQSDTKFLEDVIQEFGAPDIVLDDGSHQMKDIMASFEYLYPRLSKNGIYIVEDLHTAYWEEYGGGSNKPDTFINISKNFIDMLNAENSRGTIPINAFSKNTFAVSFYTSMIVMEKGSFGYKKDCYTGK